MDARFNSLTRGQRYTFVNGRTNAVVGVFHQYMPDGTLQVAGSIVGDHGAINARTLYINPDQIIYVEEHK
jgi:hypothetical protein